MWEWDKQQDERQMLAVASGEIPGFIESQEMRTWVNGSWGEVTCTRLIQNVFFLFHHLLFTSSHSDSFSPPIPLSLHVLSHSHHFLHSSLCSLIPFPLSPPSLPIRLFSPHLLPLSEPPGKDSHRRGDVATTHSTRLPEEKMHRSIFTQISACVCVCVFLYVKAAAHGLLAYISMCLKRQ